MPVSTYNRKHLHKALGFKIGDRELVKNIGNLGLAIKRESATEMDIEFKANRPDIISTVGLARAIRYMMRRSRSFGYDVRPAEKDFTINVGSYVKAKRPFVAAMAVRGMRLGEDELKDIINFTDKLSENYGRRREKLAIGLHDLRDVRPPFYYDAFKEDEFVPLNKAKKARYSEVVAKEEKGVRYGKLSAASGGRYVALKDSTGTMALIPVINSERTRVTKATQSMLVDITGSSRHAVEKVADVLAANFLDMKFEVYCVKVNYVDEAGLLPAMESRKITIPLDQLEREIGVRIGFNNVILLANKMGYEAGLVGKRVHFKVPPYRLDIIDEQDVIEDVAIAYGYDYIRPAPVLSGAPGNPDLDTVTRSHVSEAIIGLGYGEMMNSYLTNAKDNFKLMGLEETGHIKLSNPKTEIATMMRTWLVPSLLRCLAKSTHDRLPQKMFELDMAFGLNGEAPEESYRLAAVSCDTKVNFNDMKADLEALGKAIGIGFAIKGQSHGGFIDGRCAAVMFNGKEIGVIGEIHPEVLANFGIEQPVLAMEIRLD
ncbi:Phenylalanine--tRNA ligase beta subunit [uncultured archaeon]|nr:Phenylalanine--tRNA ligase beta subunit [uncultured archaeon]